MEGVDTNAIYVIHTRQVIKMGVNICPNSVASAEQRWKEQTMQVYCNEENCEYNGGGYCTLDEIEIDGGICVSLDEKDEEGAEE